MRTLWMASAVALACACACACSSNSDATSKTLASEAPANTANRSVPGAPPPAAPVATDKPPRTAVDPAPPDMRVDSADPDDFSATDAAPAVSADQLGAMMDVANRAYDRTDYEAARAAAHAVVALQPDNVRMLRLIVSSACILGDASEARTFYPRLPERDKKQIASRCGRYGVDL